jgi:hypothetical protein
MNNLISLINIPVPPVLPGRAGGYPTGPPTDPDVSD